MQFDDENRVEKAKKRSVVKQAEPRNIVELFRHLPQYEHGAGLIGLESKFFQLGPVHPAVYKAKMDEPIGNDTFEIETQSDSISMTTTKDKKKKCMKLRSNVWEHFTAFYAGTQRKARCNYCGIEYLAESRNGTSTFKNHLTICKNHPASIDLKQTQSSLQTREGENFEGSLTTSKFDQEFCRKKLVEIIIKDELPFVHVEGEGFVEFFGALQPKFKIPSRWTVSRDCSKLFLDEKLRLRDYFKKTGQTVCITTDTWTSLQNLNYVCITAHFIDKDWKLHKKIINFCTIESHKGEEMGRQIDGYLREWGIAKVFSVTVDNASSNDTCIQYLKGRLSARGCTLVKGKYLHMRCIAHVISLIVQDGLKEVNPSINKIRDAVRFIRQSPARSTRFKACCESENIECKSMLCLDVCTRWNSTYLMLSVAVKFQKAFERFEIEDPHFVSNLSNGNGVPTDADWENTRRMVDLLSTFYHLTIRISGSLYVTSSKFYDEVSRVRIMLKKWTRHEEKDVREMGAKMKAKADKYWGDPKKMNKLIYVAVVLDPQYKFEFIEYGLVEEYGETEGMKMANGVMEALKELLDAYKEMYFGQGDASKNMQEQAPVIPHSSTSPLSFIDVESISDKFKKRKRQSGLTSKSELDIYLEDNDVLSKQGGEFNILNWWKINEHRYPLLSRLASDVLAMPISTVASESAFSTGSRVLDPFRSSLTLNIVECLICTQDWMRRSRQLNSLEEDLENIEKLEEAMRNVGTSKVNENLVET